MPKTTKFTISVSAADFELIESLRRRAGRTRSQFIRDAVASASRRTEGRRAVEEKTEGYGVTPPSDLPPITDPAERRRRAMAAAGRFHSGFADLSSGHDRHLEDAFAETVPDEDKD